MNKYSKYLLFTLICVLGMSAITKDKSRLYEISKNIEIFVNVFKELNANYVDDIDPAQLMRTGIDAMVGSLDPYTNYISEAQVQGYRINSEGKYEGIGAIVEKIGDHITVVEPYENSPAQIAGLRAGDRIVEVNGLATKGKTQAELSTFVRGLPGTKVNFTIERPGKSGTMDVELTRGEVNITNVPYSGKVSEGIGYISLTTFTPDASKNIGGAFKKLQKDGKLNGLILDLRGNGGGLLREAISICNIWVPKDKEVVYVKGKVKDRDKSFKTNNIPMDLDIPLVILTDKSSASASEIVSGVIQDLDRGVIIGQRSYGKGLVQNTKEVGFNSRIKLTTSKYYIPSGRCIQSVEYADGEPKDIPDDQRAVFKTMNGRPVLDGGGISPDVKLEVENIPDVVSSLKQERLIFHYVTERLQQTALDTPDMENIQFEDYTDFVSFVKKSDFKFETSLENEIKELQELDEGNPNIDLGTEIAALESKLEAQKADDLTQFKPEITKLIEKEIATRYFLQKGKAYQSLKSDPVVDKAISILNDSEEYNSILSKLK